MALIENKNVVLALCVVGIVGSLLCYGVLQERVMTRPFGEDEERFTYSVFIVLHNRAISSLVALIAIALRKSPIAPVAPAYAYLGVSLSNVVATSCQYEALKYVSFPMQTLAKCSKMIPVMIWGIIINKKKYGFKDYFIALGITLGATIFVLYGDISSSATKKTANTSLWGILLMLGYLGFDGFTSTFQETLFKGFKMETYNQMLYVNFFSALVSLFTLISAFQLFPALAFVTKHMDCWFYIILLSIAATTGQFFILYTIKEYGALIFATIMTTRQFLSILLSSLLFAHPLTGGQWGGTTLIFSSLYYKTYSSKQKAKGGNSTQTPSTHETNEPMLPMKANEER